MRHCPACNYTIQPHCKFNLHCPWWRCTNKECRAYGDVRNDRYVVPPKKEKVDG